jgi:hypothetical protein
MADTEEARELPAHAGNRTGSAPDSERSRPTTPRWVKVSGIIVAALIAVVIVMLAVGGDHGPGRHLPSGDDAGHTGPPPGVDHTP